MRIRWFGQSAFLLSSGGTSVAIDPFGDMSPMAERGIEFSYPPIDAAADLLLITHEHLDHNAAEVIGGSPEVIRSTAGRLESPAGEIVAVASEHDAAAGTERGPNTVFVFSLDGERVCHFGDFGQAALRDEQAAAVGRPDVLIVPVGGGPTADAVQAAEISRSLGARMIVPMHYRTPRVSFLDPVDGFLAQFDAAQVRQLDSPEFDTADIDRSDDQPLVVVPAAP